MKIDKFFNDQSNFSKLIGIGDKLSPSDIDNITKTLALALHTEVSNLVSATSYRSHSVNRVDPDPDKILFESVDVIRYAIAIMNLWKITPEEFVNAWHSKDKYLILSRKADKRVWNGEPVAIVDMDDVLCEFRDCFSKWLSEKHDVYTDVESPEYYFINDLESKNLNPEWVFSDFISDNGFKTLRIVDGAKEFMSSLHQKGYFIHILTARPGNNLRCLYNTFEWLDCHDIKFDKISFSSEKLRWCVQSEYWDSGSISFAIDDSPKHASEYGKHGIKVYVPKKSYNTEVNNINNVHVIDSLLDCIDNV